MDKTSPEYINAIKRDGFFSCYELLGVTAKIKALAKIAGDDDLKTLFESLGKELDAIFDEKERMTFEDFNKGLAQYYEETGEKYEIVYLGKDKVELEEQETEEA